MKDLTTRDVMQLAGGLTIHLSIVENDGKLLTELKIGERRFWVATSDMDGDYMEEVRRLIKAGQVYQHENAGLINTDA
jgi:hypothetical protein